jgi:hypothetical protein
MSAMSRLVATSCSDDLCRALIGGVRSNATAPWTWIDGTNSSNLNAGSVNGPFATGQPE